MSVLSTLALLENSGLIVNGKVNVRKVKDSPKSKLMRFCEEFAEITSYKALSPSFSTYQHSASLSLGGGPYPCASILCRKKKTEQLAQFAALYSDHVYLNNFTYRHVHHPNSSGFKNELIEDVSLVAYLYPLMKEGLVSFVTYDGECPHCIAVSAIGQEMGDKFELACDSLQEMFLTDVKFYLYREGSKLCLHTEGPEHLVPHQNSFAGIARDADCYKEMNDIVGKNKSEVLLTVDQVKKFQLDQSEANDLIRSLSIELNGAHFLKTSFLSESRLEINFLKQMSDANSVRRTNLMEKHLTCMVPYLQNVEPINLLKLRNTEQDSFILFRQALTKAVEEYKSNTEYLSERDAIAIYSDFVQPEVSRLDIKFNSAKRNFSKDTTREIISWVAAISTGFYAGTFSSSFFAGSVALAGMKIGADFIKNVMAKSDAEETIRNEETYFLWKIKQMSE